MLKYFLLTVSLTSSCTNLMGMEGNHEDKSEIPNNGKGNNGIHGFSFDMCEQENPKETKFFIQENEKWRLKKDTWFQQKQTFETFEIFEETTDNSSHKKEAFNILQNLLETLNTPNLNVHWGSYFSGLSSLMHASVRKILKPYIQDLKTNDICPELSGPSAAEKMLNQLIYHVNVLLKTDPKSEGLLNIKQKLKIMQISLCKENNPQDPEFLASILIAFQNFPNGQKILQTCYTSITQEYERNQKIAEAAKLLMESYIILENIGLILDNEENLHQKSAEKILLLCGNDVQKAIGVLKHSPHKNAPQIMECIGTLQKKNSQEHEKKKKDLIEINNILNNKSLTNEEKMNLIMSFGIDGKLKEKAINQLFEKQEFHFTN